MRNSLWLVCFFLVLGLAACQGKPEIQTPEINNNPPDPNKPITIPTKTPIAMVYPTRDTVEIGAEWNLLTPIPVEATGELHENEALRVANGGEALLDFDFGLTMHLFHDTELGVVSIDSAPNAARWAEFEIFKCCVTGELTKENTQIVYLTPGGVEIQIYGTSYFIIYDPVTFTTIVGNFDGEVRVISGGREVPLQPGFSVTIPMDQPPDPPQPIDFTLSEIEDQMRNSGVVVATEFYTTATPTTTETPNSSDTPTPTQTITPSPTPTSTNTPTPTETRIPCASQLLITTNAFCRSGPGTVYTDITAFQAGTILDLLAQNPSSSNKWWKVSIPNSNASCWVSDSLVRVDGISSPSCVPEESPPPTPTYTPSPTPTISVTSPPANVPPPVPIPLSPSSGDSVGFPTTLSWSAVSDNDGIAYYRWQLENLNTGQVNSGRTQQTSVSLTTTGNTNYRWRVRAVDNTNLRSSYSGWVGFFVHFPAIP